MRADSAVTDPAPQLDDLPAQMREARRWLVWREEPSVGDKKPRKVPYYVSGARRFGELDTAQDLARMGTLDEALAALARGQHSGLGFALGPDDTGSCWQGVDLDDLAAHPELAHVVEELPGYTETSPSGKGLHAIGYGRPFTALGSNGSGIEAYSSGRYFTVTAEGAGLGEPTCLANWINATLRPLHGARPVSEATVHEVVPAATLAELRSALAAMRADDRTLWVANGQRLKRLGEAGRALWIEWSQQSDKFDPADAARVWDSCTADRTGYAAVFADAQRAGWVNPLAGSAPALRAPVPAPKLVPLDLSAALAADLDPPRYVVEPLIPRRVATLLGGHGGVGKSMLALTIAAHVAAGRSWGPYQFEQGRVVFVSMEDEARFVIYRLRRIIEVCALPAAEVLANLEIHDLTDAEAELAVEGAVRGAEALQFTPMMAAVEEASAGAALLVIDNASDAFGANENERRQVKRFIRRLTQRAKANDGATLLLAHIDKASAKSGAKGNMSSGSTAWHNSARSRLAMVETDGVLELLHEKTNHGTKAEPLLVARGPHGVPEPRLPSAVKAAAAQTAQNDAAAVLAVMEALIGDGISITTSLQGSTTSVQVIGRSPECPIDLRGSEGKERIKAALMTLERGGRIVRKSYRTESRKEKARWELAYLPESE